MQSKTQAGKIVHIFPQRKKTASEERSPQTTSSKLSSAVPQSLVFQQASSAPLGLKLIFIALVSSMFLHICSKSYYKASVIPNNSKIEKQKLATEVICTTNVLKCNMKQHSDGFYRKTRGRRVIGISIKFLPEEMHFNEPTCWD